MRIGNDDDSHHRVFPRPFHPPLGGPRARLRSSPRNYDASTTRLSCSSAAEQNFLESILAFPRPEKGGNMGNYARRVYSLAFICLFVFFVLEDLLEPCTG
jgi:hypothetical protein